LRRAPKLAIIGLVGLPIFALFVFPILYISIHDYISYLTKSNSYYIQKIDIDDFEQDVTANSFHSITEKELLRYPQVKESVGYLEGKRDPADLTSARVYCDRGECSINFAIKRIDSAKFLQTYEFDGWSSLLEYKQNYYRINQVIPYDPPSYYFDAYTYSFWMILIGIPIIVIVWIIEGMHNGRKVAARRPDR
jgi:hypothetical protein